MKFGPDVQHLSTISFNFSKAKVENQNRRTGSENLPLEI